MSQVKLYDINGKKSEFMNLVHRILPLRNEYNNDLNMFCINHSVI